MFITRMGFVIQQVRVTGVAILLLAFMPVVALFEDQKIVQAYQEQDFERAHALAMAQLVEKQKDLKLLYNTGDIAYRRGEFEQAKAYFQEVGTTVLSHDPLYIKSWFNHGNCCMQRKEFEKAIESYDRVLTVEADQERATYNKNKALGLLKKEEYKKHDNPDSEDAQHRENPEQQNANNKDQQGSGGQQNGQENKGNNQQQNNEQGDQSKQNQSSDDQDNDQNAGQDENSNSQENHQSNASGGASGKQRGDQQGAQGSSQDFPQKVGEGDQQEKQQNEGKDQGDKKENNADETKQGTGEQGQQHNDSPQNNDLEGEGDTRKGGKSTEGKKQSKKATLYAQDVQEQVNPDSQLSDEQALLLQEIDQQDKDSGKYLFKLQTRSMNHAGKGHKNW